MAQNNKVDEQQEKISVKAFDVASSFDLNAARKVLEEELHGKLLEDNPLLVQFNPQRMVGVFDYGAIVFFDVEPDERRSLIEKLKRFTQRENAIYSEDDFILNIASRTMKPEGTDE